MSHDGTRVFVANEDAAIASVVDVATGKILDVSNRRGTRASRFSRGAERVWVTSEDDGTAVVIDLPSQGRQGGPGWSQTAFGRVPARWFEGVHAPLKTAQP